MKLTFDFQIKNLKGEEFKGEDNNASSLLANVISQSNKGSAVKLWDWALKIYNKQEVTFSETDLDVLKAIIDESQTLPVITKAQILQHIEKKSQKK